MSKVILHKKVNEQYFLHVEQDNDGYHAQLGVYSDKEQTEESFVGCAFGSGHTLGVAIDDARKNIHPDYATDSISWR